MIPSAPALVWKAARDARASSVRRRVVPRVDAFGIRRYSEPALVVLDSSYHCELSSPSSFNRRGHLRRVR